MIKYKIVLKVELEEDEDVVCFVNDLVNAVDCFNEGDIKVDSIEKVGATHITPRDTRKEKV